MQLRDAYMEQDQEVPLAVSGSADSQQLALEAAEEVKGLKRHLRVGLAQQYALGIGVAPLPSSSQSFGCLHTAHAWCWGSWVRPTAWHGLGVQSRVANAAGCILSLRNAAVSCSTLTNTSKHLASGVLAVNMIWAALGASCQP